MFLSYPNKGEGAGACMHQLFVHGLHVDIPPWSNCLHLGRKHLGEDMKVLAFEAGLACTEMVKARGYGLATVALATNPQYKLSGRKNQLLLNSSCNTDLCKCFICCLLQFNLYNSS